MIRRLTAGLRYSWASIPVTLRRNFGLDFAASVCMGIFMGTIAAFVPVVARRLGATPILLSLIVAAPVAGNTLAPLAAHYLQGRRKLPYMTSAWGLGRGLFLLMPFVVAPVPFVGLVVTHWLIVGLPVPAYVEVMRQMYPDVYRGRLMASARVGFTASMTLLTPLVGRLLDSWGYRTVFPIAACFGVAAAVTFSRVRYDEVVSDRRRGLGESWRILGADARFRRYLVATMTWGFGAFMMMPLVPILLVDELRLNYSQVGLLGLVNSGFWMLFYLIWGRFVDRSGGLRTMQVNVLLSAIIPLSLLASGTIWPVVAAYVVMGITNAGTDLGWMNAVMQFARRDQVADYTALYATLAGIRGLIAPLLGTVLMSAPGIGIRGVFLMSALLVLFSWLLMRRVTLGAPAAAASHSAG